MRQLFCGRAQSRERHPPGFCDYDWPGRLALAFRSRTPCAFYPAKSMPSAAAMRKPLAPSNRETVSDTVCAVEYEKPFADIQQ